MDSLPYFFIVTMGVGVVVYAINLCIRKADK